MTGTTSTYAAILRPEQVGDLLITPTAEQSVAIQVSESVVTESGSYRIPVVSDDPSASWVAEGAEITPSDMVLNEITVTPSKVAGLSIVSSELAADSSPAAAEAVGSGLARDIARRVDEAFFGNMSAPAPAGLGSLTLTAVDAGTAWSNADVFLEALSNSEQVGATVTSFVANPADALALAQLKESSTSNRPLLGTDVTAPTRRLIAGVALFVSPYVTAGTVWAIPKDRVVVVIRSDAEVEADSSPFFTSDRVAVRARMRIGFGFPHHAAVAKITLSA